MPPLSTDRFVADPAGFVFHGLDGDGSDIQADALAVMKRCLRTKYSRAWIEADHPRGQPDNKGKFRDKDSGSVATLEDGELEGDREDLDEPHGPDYQAVLRVFESAADRMANSGAGAEASVQYKKLAAGVLSRFKPQALKKLRKNIKRVQFFPTLPDLTNEMLSRFKKDHPDVDTESAMIGGCYNREERTLYLDGDDPRWHQRMGFTVLGIYAHEMSHALDGSLHEVQHSTNMRWILAAGREIAGADMSGENLNKPLPVVPPLTEYARTSPQEAWAEFGRMVITHPEAAQEKFPKCWEFWHGLGFA